MTAQKTNPASAAVVCQRVKGRRSRAAQPRQIASLRSSPAASRATKPPLGEAGEENPDRPKNYQPGAAQNRSGASTSPVAKRRSASIAPEIPASRKRRGVSSAFRPNTPRDSSKRSPTSTRELLAPSMPCRMGDQSRLIAIFPQSRMGSEEWFSSRLPSRARKPVEFGAQCTSELQHSPSAFPASLTAVEPAMFLALPDFPKKS